MSWGAFLRGVLVWSIAVVNLGRTCLTRFLSSFIISEIFFARIRISLFQLIFISIFLALQSALFLALLFLYSEGNCSKTRIVANETEKMLWELSCRTNTKVKVACLKNSLLPLFKKRDATTRDSKSDQESWIAIGAKMNPISVNKSSFFWFKFSHVDSFLVFFSSEP